MRSLPNSWPSFPPWARELILALRAEVMALRKENAGLREQVSTLQTKLDAALKNPRNSSKPPASGHPHAKPRPSTPPSGRRPGGQPGHDKHQRALIPPENRAAVHDHRPRRCDHCGVSLRHAVPDADPVRKQIWDIPRSSRLSPSIASIS